MCEIDRKEFFCFRGFCRIVNILVILCICIYFWKIYIFKIFYYMKYILYIDVEGLML